MKQGPGPSEGTSLGDLRDAAQERLRDAEALFQAGRYASSIAFGLYALEIQVKVSVCLHLERDDLPKHLRVHDLGLLLTYSGLLRKIKNSKRPRHLNKNWGELLEVAADVTDFRYKSGSDEWDQAKAGRVLDLLRDRPDGVLLWFMSQASLKTR